MTHLFHLACPECGGSGLDHAHTYPNGSHPYCENCDGYGQIRSDLQLAADFFRAALIVAAICAFPALVWALAVVLA